jgi:hypothetical protein
MRKAQREVQKADDFIAKAIADAKGSVEAEGPEISTEVLDMVEQAARGEISFDAVLRKIRERSV